MSLELLRRAAPLIADLSVCNPFTPRRIELEHGLAAELGLGDSQPGNAVPWNESLPTPVIDTRLQSLLGGASELMKSLSKQGPALRGKDAVLWRELVLFVLFHRTIPAMDRLIESGLSGGASDRRMTAHRSFSEELARLTGGVPSHEGVPLDPGTVLGLFFQLRRAFCMIHRHLVGGSVAMAVLRASIWESIFTHDLGRYRRVLRGRMDDFSTLITGPSGSGKELVARALALSSHVPFDPATGCFTRDFSAGYFALNLSALSQGLVESELFGHRRGSFTGAVADRAGWLEQCPEGGTVFLDEIGETPAALQVKLLRVLQAREFQRIGESDTRRFTGRIIAATHRDLAREIAEGRFREDFYFRLCADRIETPSLASQIAGSEAELRRLCGWVCARLVHADEADALADGLCAQLSRSPGIGYAWPGNFRELEQAARTFLIRRTYLPPGRAPSGDAGTSWSALFLAGDAPASEVLSVYCRRVLELCGGNVEAAARRLGLDRRTVQARVRQGLRSGGE